MNVVEWMLATEALAADKEGPAVGEKSGLLAFPCCYNFTVCEQVSQAEPSTR